MDKRDLTRQLQAIFQQTLEHGPGPRAVAEITADQLSLFLQQEAGAAYPEVVDAICDRLRENLKTVSDEC